MFRRLSVFAGGCRLDAADAVCGSLSANGVLDELDSLAAKSLIQETHGGGEPRFVTLETIREFAAEKLAESGEEDAVHRLHGGHYLQLARRAFPHLRDPEQVAWLARLEEEQDNLRVALGWWERAGEAEPALDLIEQVWWFWLVRGYLGEGRERLASILALPTLLAGTPLRAWALHLGGQLAFYQADYQAARAMYADRVGIWRERGDVEQVLHALHDLGTALTQLDQLSAAEECYQEILSFGESTGDGYHITIAAHHLGNIAHARGDLATARRRFEEGLEVCRRATPNWRDIEGLILQSLGTVLRDQGDASGAKEYFRRGVEILGEIGDHRAMAIGLTNLGEMALAEGDVVAARARFAEAVAIHRDLGDRGGLAQDIERLAGVALARRQPRLTLRLAGSALALREAVGAPMPVAIREKMEALLAFAERAIGSEAAQSAWNEGRAMAWERAVDQALAMPTPEQVASPLTRREREVAGLLAEGLSDRQIGERLVITEGTVGVHVVHILEKLGFRSRAQVAAWVAQASDTAPSKI